MNGNFFKICHENNETYHLIPDFHLLSGNKYVNSPERLKRSYLLSTPGVGQRKACRAARPIYRQRKPNYAVLLLLPNAWRYGGNRFKSLL